MIMRTALLAAALGIVVAGDVAAQSRPELYLGPDGDRQRRQREAERFQQEQQNPRSPGLGHQDTTPSGRPYIGPSHQSPSRDRGSDSGTTRWRY